jgi:hypothetical protein
MKLRLIGEILFKISSFLGSRKTSKKSSKRFILKTMLFHLKD